jgi:predicted enzyme related to lactoylglutathione lyase
MTIGSLRATTVDVNDLEEGERFWQAVTGLPVTLHAWGGHYSRLGTVGQGAILLQRVEEPGVPGKNRVHLDITVDDVDDAVEAVLALGGTLQHAPRIFPEDGDAGVEYAVMVDPFGNEFCLVRELPAM